MISPELLRIYPFFGVFDDAQQKALAMIAEEELVECNQRIFTEGEPAEAFYFLVEGSVDFYFGGNGINLPEFRNGIPVGLINPGEPFGISALIEPHNYTSTATASMACRIIKFKAADLDSLLKNDCRLDCLLGHQAARVAIERLYTTRTELAAAMAD